MNNTSKNLGLISSIKTSTTPPSNKNLLWIDTNTVPPTKRAFDIATQSWLEVVFIASPANVLKKQIILAPNDAAAITAGQIFNIEAEDIFVKGVDLDFFLNLPIPSNNFLGKVFEIVNQTTSPIFFNQPISYDEFSDIESFSERGNMRIVCAFQYNAFRWILLSKTTF